jgi:hypothetical protein
MPHKVSNKTEKKTDQDEEDESVSSKTQIMTLFTVDVDRVADFVWHEFAVFELTLSSSSSWSVFFSVLLSPSSVSDFLLSTEEAISFLTSVLLNSMVLSCRRMPACKVVVLMDHMMPAMMLTETFAHCIHRCRVLCSAFCAPDLHQISGE